MIADRAGVVKGQTKPYYHESATMDDVDVDHDP